VPPFGTSNSAQQLSPINRELLRNPSISKKPEPLGSSSTANKPEKTYKPPADYRQVQFTRSRKLLPRLAERELADVPGPGSYIKVQPANVKGVKFTKSKRLNYSSSVFN